MVLDQELIILYYKKPATARLPLAVRPEAGPSTSLRNQSR
jgi:hypothetical protein